MTECHITCLWEMLAGYDFGADRLQALAKGNSRFARIEGVFRKMRERVKSECAATRSLLEKRLTHLEALMNEEYCNLYESASPAIKDRLEIMWNRENQRRAPASEQVAAEQNPESWGGIEIEFGWKEEEDDEDIFFS
jgi:hypothetical protein